MPEVALSADAPLGARRKASKMTLKTHLMLSGAFGGMTATERRLGRFIRDGEGHPAPAPAAPAGEAAPANVFAGDHEDFSAFESDLSGDGGADDDEDTKTGDVDPGSTGSDDDGIGDKPPADADEGGSDQQQSDDLETLRQEAKTAREEADAAKREADELRRKADKPAEAKPEESTAEEAPNPEDYEFGEADPKFIADHARFHAREEFRQQQSQAELRAEFAKVDAKWAESIADPTVSERYPDFQEKVVKGADRGDWACSPLMALALKESDVGPDVAHHLASNPSESARIAGLHPLEQAREFGRLEGRYTAERAKPAAPVKLASDAPAPPQGRARGSGGKFATSADTDDFSAFDSMADGILTKKR